MFGRYVGLIRSIAVRGVGCTFLVLASVGSAQAVVLNFRADGLPSGLQLGATVKFVTCTNGSAGFRNAGSVQLTEDSTTTIERVTLPSGQQIFTSVVHYFYTGTLQVAPLTDNGCGTAIADNTFVYDYVALGANASGSAASRVVGSSVRVLSGSVMTLSDTLRARTTQIVRSGIVPTSLQMGVEHRLSATYEDSAGQSAVRNPTLEITRQALVNGLLLNFSMARAVLNSNNQVCVTSSGETACRTLSSGGTVAAGFLTVHLSHSASMLSGDTRIVTWAVTIDPSLGAGSFGINAKADDFDTISYFVNGNAEEIDLLPWKALRIPVDLVN